MSVHDEKHVCCICKKEFVGWGHSPNGALDENLNLIKWNSEDVCCDECNLWRVVEGRFISKLWKEANA